MKATHSIARRLILTVLLVEFASALISTGATVIELRHVRFRALEATLRGHADSLLGAVQDAESGDDVMLDGTQTTLPRADLYQVTDDRGKLLGQSGRWSERTRGAFSEPQPNGFSQMRIDGVPYRMFSMHGVRIVDPDKHGGIPRTVHILYASSEEHARHEIAEAVEFSAGSGLLVLVLTGGLLAWLLHRELSPLRELASQAAGVSVDSWGFVPSERALATAELAPMAHALRTVLSGLESSFRQQERFVSDAAHELKTAAAVVKSSLQLLAMRPRTPDVYQAGIARAEQDCERMEDLVQRMLALARAEASPQPAAGATGDLAEALRATIRQLEPLAEMRQIQIESYGQPRIEVGLEPEELRLVCSNLLLNAIQHSPAGARVAASASLLEGRAELHIEDHGAGIEPRALPHVFERFYRSDRSRSRETGGAGLGLAIVKAVVDRAHGEIEIASSPENGTAVTVRFPAGFKN